MIASVAELVDALDSKSSGSDTVPVRVRPEAPLIENNRSSLARTILYIRGEMNMTKEIISDNCYYLHPKTLLFAILVQPNHIDEDIVQIAPTEWDDIIKRFMNTGRPMVGINCPRNAAERWFGMQPYISIFGDTCTVDTKMLIGDFDYTTEEKEYLDAIIAPTGNRHQHKTYALFCRLGIDIRLTDDDLTATLLNLRFLNIPDEKLQKDKTPQLRPVKPTN